MTVIFAILVVVGLPALAVGIGLALGERLVRKIYGEKYIQMRAKEKRDKKARRRGSSLCRFSALPTTRRRRTMAEPCAWLLYWGDRP